jgi:hypothetical protein
LSVIFSQYRTYSLKSQLQLITRLLIQVCVSWRNSHLGTRTPYILLPCILPSLILPALCILHSLFKVSALSCLFLFYLAFPCVTFHYQVHCFIMLFHAYAYFDLLYLPFLFYCTLLYLAEACFILPYRVLSSILPLCFTLLFSCLRVPCYTLLYLASLLFLAKACFNLL